MINGHKEILAEFGAELVSEVERADNRGPKGYLVRHNGQEYYWSVSSVNRQKPPWESDRKSPSRYKYGTGRYIYRMYNDKDDLLYVGKTSQLDYRLYAHFYKYREDWKDEVTRIDAHRFDNESDMHVYEMYLITKHKPVFNRDAVCTDVPSFVLPELVFEEVTDWD